MAYIEPEEQEEDNPEQTRESGVISGSSVAARPSAQPSKSGYVNVQRYVEANKPGIGEFASQIAGGVKGAVNQSRSSTGQLFQDFQSQQAPEQDYSSLANLIGQGGVQGGEAAGIQQAQKAYKAPRQLSETKGYDKALQESQEAMDMLGLLRRGPSGYGALAQKVVKPQQYTQGVRGLDSALLAADPEARALTSAKEFEGTPDWLSDTSAKAADIGSQSAASRAAGLDLLRGAAGGRFTALDEDLRRQEAAAKATYDAEQKKQIDDYLNYFYGMVNPGGLIGKPRLDISPYIKAQDLGAQHYGQFATDEQVAESELLRSLMDPGYNVARGPGYGSPSAANIDKAAFEKAAIEALFKDLPAPAKYEKPVEPTSQDLETQVGEDWLKQARGVPGIAGAGKKKAESKKKERTYVEEKTQAIGRGARGASF